jgi:hypothetical protein
MECAQGENYIDALCRVWTLLSREEEGALIIERVTEKELFEASFF